MKDVWHGKGYLIYGSRWSSNEYSQLFVRVSLSIEDLLHERGADFASPGRASPHKEDQACHYACSKTKREGRQAPPNLEGSPLDLYMTPQIQRSGNRFQHISSRLWEQSCHLCPPFGCDCYSSRRKNTKKMNWNLIPTWIRPQETSSGEWKQKLKLEDKSLNFLKGEMRIFYNIQIRKVFSLMKKHNLLQKCEFVLSKSVTRRIIDWENLRQINPERITEQN